MGENSNARRLTKLVVEVLHTCYRAADVERGRARPRFGAHLQSKRTVGEKRHDAIRERLGIARLHQVAIATELQRLLAELVLERPESHAHEASLGKDLLHPNGGLEQVLVTLVMLEV